MTNRPRPRPQNSQHAGAIDARSIVPVRDLHGGLTIYYEGRPAHYLLGGEWYAAVPKPVRRAAESTAPLDATEPAAPFQAGGSLEPPPPA